MSLRNYLDMIGYQPPRVLADYSDYRPSTADIVVGGPPDKTEPPPKPKKDMEPKDPPQPK